MESPAVSEVRPMRVLVVDDDADLRTAISETLRAAGFDVDTATVRDLRDADFALAATAYDCIILDRSPAGVDARSYVEDRREAGWTAPVVFLRAENDSRAKLGSAELVERVRALSRRLLRSGVISSPPIVRVGDLEIDRERHQARRDDVALALTRNEFAVLEALATRLGQTVSRADLLDDVWGETDKPPPHVLDVVIATLRKKLGRPTLIQTVRGVGYRLTTDAGRQGSQVDQAETSSARTLQATGERLNSPRIQTVPRRKSGRAGAFLDGLAGAFSFGMPLDGPSTTGLADAAVANIADAAQRVVRAGADD
jgi:two-component system copper resistance phosphate regulon response regulator CusR